MSRHHSLTPLPGQNACQTPMGVSPSALGSAPAPSVHDSTPAWGPLRPPPIPGTAPRPCKLRVRVRLGLCLGQPAVGWVSPAGRPAAGFPCTPRPPPRTGPMRGAVGVPGCWGQSAQHCQAAGSQRGCARCPLSRKDSIPGSRRHKPARWAETGGRGSVRAPQPAGPVSTSSLKHPPGWQKRTFALRQLPPRNSCFLWGLEDKRVSGKDSQSPCFPLG